MKAALLACLLALPVAAQAPGLPADAPTTTVLKAGQPAPSNGVFLTDAQADAVANEVQAGQSRVSLTVVLVAVGLSLAGGVALGVAIGRVTK